MLLREMTLFIVRSTRNPRYSLWANAKYINVRIERTYRPVFCERGTTHKTSVRGKSKGKGKVHPITGHESPEEDRGIIYSFFNLGAGWGWVVNATLRLLYPRERPGTHFIGGRLGPRAGLDGCGISRPHRDSITGPSTP